MYFIDGLELAFTYDIASLNFGMLTESTEWTKVKNVYINVSILTLPLSKIPQYETSEKSIIKDQKQKECPLPINFFTQYGFKRKCYKTKLCIST